MLWKQVSSNITIQKTCKTQQCDPWRKRKPAVGTGAVQSVGISHKRGQLSERLAPASTHSKQQGISQGLAQDAAYAAHMLNGIHEEHQFHLSGSILVVIVHAFLHHFHQLDDMIR